MGCTLLSGSGSAPDARPAVWDVGHDRLAVYFDFTDADAGDVHTATADFGDGSPVEALLLDEPGTSPARPDTGTAYGLHAYGAAGSHAVTLTLTDAAGNATSQQFTVLVGQPAGAPFVGPTAPDAGTGMNSGGDSLAWDGGELDGPSSATSEGGTPSVTAVLLDGAAWSPAFESHLAAEGRGGPDGYALHPLADAGAVFPWTNLTRVGLRFGGPVTVGPADLRLLGVNTAHYDFDPAGFTYDAGTYTATWALPAALPRDNLLADLGGAAAGDFEFRLDLLPGDADRDRDVDLADTDDVRFRQGTSPASPGTAPYTYTAFHDVDGNAAINIFDTLAVRNLVGTTLPTGTPGVPAAPAALYAAAAGPGRIDLAWPDPSTFEDGFHLDRSTSADFAGAATFAVGPNVTTYQDAGLAPATTYHYRVRAYRGTSSSANSATASATTLPEPPTSAPAGFTLTPDGRRMVLTWQSVDGADGYKVYRKEGDYSGNPADLQAHTSTQGTSFTDDGLRPDTRYTYAVAAVNAGGEGPQSGTESAWTGGAPWMAGLTTVAEKWDDDPSTDDKQYKLTLSQGTLGAGVVIDHWVIHWGDGSGPQTVTGGPQDVWHQYADGPLAAVVTATAYDAGGAAYPAVVVDAADQFLSNTLTVNVEDVPPVLGNSGPSWVEEGREYALTLSVDEPDPGDDTITKWKVYWGDGTTTEVDAVNGGPPAGPVKHVFADGLVNLDITVKVIQDNDPTREYPAAYTRPVSVLDRAPTTVGISGAGATAEGQTYTLDLDYADPGVDPVAYWDIDWGDGSPAERFDGPRESVTHVYRTSRAAPYRVSAKVNNGDGTFDAHNTHDVTVADTPPTASITGGPDTLSEGESYTLELTTSDVGTDQITSWSVNWGDGTIDPIDGSLRSATHVYRSGPSTKTITATVTDGDGPHPVGNALSVEVANVAPTVSIGGPATADEGETYRLNLSRSDPGHEVVEFWRIDWGDGTPPADVAGYLTSAPHVFQPGVASATVSASVKDGDGTYAAQQPHTVDVIPKGPGESLVAQATSADSVRLDWSDRSAIEADYEIQRKVGGDGAWATLATPTAAATTFTDTGLTPETRYYYRVRARGAAGDSAWSNEANAAPASDPRLASGGEAKITPNPVNGTTATLSALGEVDAPGSETNLTYTWSTVSKPDGAADPSFAANGSNAAKNSAVTFRKAGDYTFEVTIRNGNANPATSRVDVTVEQTPTGIAVAPASVPLQSEQSQAFTATAKDQFGHDMETQPSFTWAVEPAGFGEITADGVYTAPREGTGLATIRASAGNVSGVATAAVGVAEVIGPWAIVAAPTEAAMVSGQPVGWHGGVSTVADAFTGISIIADGAILDTGPVIEMTFATGTLANEAGPDLVAFNLEWSQDAYGVTVEYGGYAKEFLIGNGTQLPDGRQSTYDWDDIGVPGPPTSGGKVVAKAIDLDYFNVPAGQVIEKVRVKVLDGRGGADLLGVGSLNAAKVDLDIDSDNNNGFDPNFPRSFTDNAEDEIEDDQSKPGKLIGVNDNDTDGDGVTDFADFDGIVGEQFVPLGIELPSGMNVETAQVTFDYLASDPGGMSLGPSGDVIPAPGHLRLWTEPGDEVRAENPVGTAGGGDFLASGEAYRLADLPATTRVSDRVWRVWVEAVRRSATTGDQALSVHLDADGTGRRVAADKVRATAVSVVAIDAQAFGPQRKLNADGSDNGYTFADPLTKEQPATTHVYGAATDGSSLLVLRLLPDVGNLPGQARYELSEDNQNKSISAYRTGALFAADAARLPMLPAPDEVDGVQEAQPLEYGLPDGKGLALYRPPNNFLLEQGHTDKEFGKVYLRVLNANGQPLVASGELTLRRPPLLLVHGFLGGPGSFPDETMDETQDPDQPVKWKSEEGPYTTIIKKVDYEGTNTRGFDENFKVIPDTISAWLTSIRSGNEPSKFPELNKRRFAVTRVDVVAHSMGGVLTKWFVADFRGYLLQNPDKRLVSRDPLDQTSPGEAYDKLSLDRAPQHQYLRDNNFGGGDIRRFMSAGTPFQGSKLANDMFTKVQPTAENIRKLRDHADGSNVGLPKRTADIFFAGNKDGPYVKPNAIADLREKETADQEPSVALVHLNRDAVFPAGRAKVKWHAMTGQANATAQEIKNEESVLFEVLFRIAQDVVGADLSQSIPADGDLVVSRDSGRDGLAVTAPNTTTFNSVAHVGVPIKNLPGLFSSSAVATRVRNLLIQPPADNLLFGVLDKRAYG